MASVTEQATTPGPLMSPFSNGVSQSSPISSARGRLHRPRGCLTIGPTSPPEDTTVAHEDTTVAHEPKTQSSSRLGCGGISVDSMPTIVTIRRSEAREDRVPRRSPI